MTQNGLIERTLARFPRSAAAGYAVVIVLLLAGAAWSISDVLERRQDVAATAERLSQLETRNPARLHPVAGASAPVITGSPFLEGPTVTVAGASLMERLTGAITHVGGTILSSQVDLQGLEAKDGFVTVSMSCEIEQPSLQKLLYDLEAGMPFLFVDQVVAQSPEGTSNALGDKLHVLISVSGQWQAVK